MYRNQYSNGKTAYPVLAIAECSNGELRAPV